MDAQKLAAAKEALRLVGEGETVGLGSGSTSEIFVRLLAEKDRKERLGLSCIATSSATERLARRLGLKLVGFESISRLDAAFDGADQVDCRLRLIKGLGGALVREKIVDYRAEKFVVMVGESKLAQSLSGIVPVEVIPMAEEAVKRDLLGMGALSAETRMSGKRKFLSDNSNLIIHAKFGKIENPRKLEEEINRIAGVVDNGIFARKKPAVVVGSQSGAKILV
ncbi:MAG: ribose-5-phosphate isomerase RpiA [Candidatus Micrarchaeota archaeon]|nr:ribose-5-phosphate isomerase RpiA [Candidatus Micrarchaeota archaeon]